MLIVLGALSLGLSAVLLQMFYTFTARSAFGDEAILSGLALGACGIFWSLAGWRLRGIAILLLGGLLLIGKPFLYPMISDPETGRTFALDSETHLNFLLPGAVLAAFALLLAIAGRAGDVKDPPTGS